MEPASIQHLYTHSFGDHDRVRDHCWSSRADRLEDEIIQLAAVIADPVLHVSYRLCLVFREDQGVRLFRRLHSASGKPKFY